MPDLRRGLSADSRCAPLGATGAGELHLAASVLGVFPVAVANYPDGALPLYPLAELTEGVRHAIRRHSADLLLGTDPAGGPDGTPVARAACAAARRLACQRVRTGPAARGAWISDLGAGTATARSIQKAAAAARQPVQGTAPADSPPGPARPPGATALAGPSAPAP